MSDSIKKDPGFSDFELPAALLRAIQSVGYETPTPIQNLTLPPLLEGKDVLGRAPTGTGKTAAFALPVLARLDTGSNAVQALVLTPTRELAIQVAEAFTRYATHMSGLRVLPVYGGQDYGGQVRQLRRGVQVVVGTPGRIMDHMRRGTLKLDQLSTLVLDEADEMLRMGFIDDVEWILEQTPGSQQMALFSATMPKVIKRIAGKHMKNPVEIQIEGKQTTADTIRQRYWMVSGLHKLDALTRILEVEPFDAILVFVRTRLATVELAERLSARGFSTAAMNGDMPQSQREQMVEKLRKGGLDILVATDVVARGLDVNRISHVVNYDIPYDTEAYVHRIGRTGRAGRSGDAILFVTPRERRLLKSIEKATRQQIEELELPTVEMVNNRRIADFKQRISDTLATGELAYMQRLVEDYVQEHNVPATRVAAALAKLLAGDQSLLLKPDSKGKNRQSKSAAARESRERNSAVRNPERPKPAGPKHDRQKPAGPKTERPKQERQQAERPRQESPQSEYPKSARPSPDQPSSAHLISAHPQPAHPAQDASAEQFDSGKSKNKPQRKPSTESHISAGTDSIEMEKFRVAVGEEHGVLPANLVGAIANEAGIDSAFIGRISIQSDHSIVELPTGMPKFLLKDLKRVWVCNRKLNIARIGEANRDEKSPKKDKSESNKRRKEATESVTSRTGKAPKSKDRKRKNKARKQTQKSH